MAHCVCSCGRKTDVRVNNLHTGVTKSCGAPKCRMPPLPVAKDADYAPYGSRALTKPQIRKMWGLYNDDKKALSVLKIAEKLGVNHNTCYSTLRSIRRAGGLDVYLAKVA